MHLSHLKKILSLLAFLSIFAHGHELKGQPFEFYGEEQAMRDVLTAIATHSRLGIQVNEDVDVDFSGHLKQRNSLDALNYLSATYDLVWYSDGATLFVDPINAMQSRLFHLDHVAARQVQRTMQDLSIWDGRFEWRSLSNKSILMVSGPPRYLELVDETINLLNTQVMAASEGGLSVKIFKLKHASASDRKVTARGEEIVLPGVATLLQGLLVSGGDGAVAESFGAVKTNTRIGSLGREGDEDDALSDKEEPVRQARRQPNKAKSTQTLKGAPHPQAAIYPDPVTNSIIVQDYGSRLVFYADVISQLDTPRQQLEISLLIIDLTTSSLRDLGVDWNVATRSAGKGLVDLILPGSSQAVRENLTQTNVDFLASVTALESKGKARVTSRPAVVTENGMEALLDNNETFFVKVLGERVASLEEVTFGTLLQVVPRIMEDETSKQQQMINLDVRIEDGNRLADGNVDALPSIRNTQITTVSSVPNGGSLLIGGYYREATTSNRDDVPVLGNIPVFGNLFRHSGNSKSQLVRLFMLSPRILSDSAYEAELNESETAYDHNYSSTSDQISQLSDLSNFNPEIKRLRYTGECESALNARQRRNSYSKANVTTRIVRCQSDDEESTYRVITL